MLYRTVFMLAWSCSNLECRREGKGSNKIQALESLFRDRQGRIANPHERKKDLNM